MKLTKTLVAVAALIAMSTSVTQAGLWSRITGNSSKCCDCAPTFQPDCCKPVIVRPCHVNCYSYQRACAKPMCCDGSVNGCCPVGNNCCDNNNNCCNTGGCNTGCNGCAPVCAAPCYGQYGGNNCCAPCNNGCNNGCCASCAAPCDNGCCNTNNCCNINGCCDNGCNNTCAVPCCDDSCCDNTCCEDACIVAQLIYSSQTACYARQRRAAIIRLGRFDCVCNPEIMSAFVYALNDAVETVRAAAADEIGDQLRKNPCCCSQCVVCALTNALADCDRGVRRQAEQALRLCGYDVVDGCCVDQCCDVVCDAGCAPACGSCGINGMSPPAPTTEEAPAQPTLDGDAVPAPPTSDEVVPAPPSEERAYFPSQLEKQAAHPTTSRRSLKNLFSFLK